MLWQSSRSIVICSDSCEGGGKREERNHVNIARGVARPDPEGRGLCSSRMSISRRPPRINEQRSAVPFVAAGRPPVDVLYRLLGYGDLLVQVVMSATALNKHLTSVRPGGTTFVAKDIEPAKDKSSCFEQVDFTSQGAQLRFQFC